MSRRVGVPVMLTTVPLVVYVLAFVVPVVLMLATSFTVFDRREGIQPGFSLANYIEFLASERNVGLVIRTVIVSVLATVASLVIGYPVAYYISRVTGRLQNYLILLVVLPLLVLVVVRSFGWVIILGNAGAINSLLMGAGLIDSPIRMLYTDAAIVVGLVHVWMPFMVLAIFASLRNIDESLITAARGLGASSRRAFLRVTLPLSVPGIAAGSILVFTLSMSAFATPALLGGSGAPVMTYALYQEILLFGNWPMGSAIATLLLIGTGLVVFVYLRLVENERYRRIYGQGSAT